MFAKATQSPAVPSHNALRVLRQLAFAGSTGLGLCTVAALTYDVHRRVHIAEQIIENKRTIRTSAPNYDATSSAKRLAVMMEAAEAGEFMGLESLKHKLSPRGTREPESATKEASPDTKAPPPPEMTREFRSTYFSNPNDEFEYVQGVPGRDVPGRRRESPADGRHELGRAKEPTNVEDLRDQVMDLIQQDREVQATTLFLQNFHPEEGESIPQEMEMSARALFVANCKRGNVFVARALFKRLEIVLLDRDIWAMMMLYLAKKGHVESVGYLYDKYQTRLKVPAYLLEVTLRCLLESRRLNSAKALFYGRLADDQGGGLCGAFLDGLWRKTRRRDLVTAEFRKILSRLVTMGRQPTEKIFNPVVKAYIESGHFEDAKALVLDMPRKYQIQPGCRTLGLIAYSKALLCDWDDVMVTLREMHSLGHTQEKTNFAHVFDRVFLEYYPTHSGPQIYQFLVRCIEEFDLVPDRVLHRHMIEALLERGDAESLHHIARIGEERKWESGLDEKQVMQILQARQVSMQGTPVGMWRMLQAAKEQYGRAASTNRLMGAGSDSFKVGNEDREVLQPIFRPAEEIFEKVTQDFVAKPSLNFYVPLDKRMEQRIHAGHFRDALNSFRRADATGFLFHPEHLKLAVIATILEHGVAGLGDARKIIHSHAPYANQTSEEYRHRFPRFTPIFFQQILQIGGKGRLFDVPMYKLALFEFYRVCADTPNLTVKNHALAAISQRLITTGSAPGAIKLLTAFYLSRWRQSHGFDQVLLKLFLRAYAITGKAKGVWWCMMTVLSRPEPVHREFVAEAELLMPALEKQFSSPDLKGEPSANIKILRRIVWALWKKYYGDAPFANARFCPERKKARRAKVITRTKRNQAALPDMSIESMISSFDEEMELDFLVGRRKFDESAILKWWDEKSAPFQTRVHPEYVEYPAPPGFYQEGEWDED
ncbi:hypothetical protein N7492_000201 [Penicillium capsulatum]|uniref:Pentatricopeptide repeat protein n=1 Tax=Penicillium capsulatum TaxID=69766 RepID=A0A9W9IPZ2_9EURO|nr:hypothetical protein N7492_000201 [Penicillium capsulatum]KAJ6130734.1 hypothetical protein N7512_003514 [Penicillium capsulatum]